LLQSFKLIALLFMKLLRTSEWKLSLTG